MTFQSEAETQGPRTRRVAWIVAGVVILAGAAGLAAVYGIGRFGRNAGDAACRPAVETARRVAPLIHGEVAALAAAREPWRVPDLAFVDATGAAKRLADWRGRVVLFNLWATWCVPCRKEMPALDRLETTLGGPRFDVVAVNIDTRDPARPRAWLKDVGVNRLAYYADPSAKVFQDLKLAGHAFGMPTTLILDGRGCEVGTLAGPAEWASQDAVKLLEAVVGS